MISAENASYMQTTRRTLGAQCCVLGTCIIAFLVSSCLGSPQLSVPTIGDDQLIYACINQEVVAFQRNGMLAWSVGMNQTCQTGVAAVIDYDGKVYVAADRTVVVVTPAASDAAQPSAADFFSMVPAASLKAIGNFSSITGLAVTPWSSVLYINTGTGIHTFMLDGTPLWSTLVQFNNREMKSPESMGPCAHNMTNCSLLPTLAVDQCDGSVYVARTDGWLFSFATWQPFMRWRYVLSIDVPLSVNLVTGSNGRIYATIAKYDTVYALSTELGSLVWQAQVGPLGDTSCTPVVDLLGYVSIGSLDGFLYVISPDGKQVRKYLAADSSALVSIQISPVLDCSKKALFVAQTRVKSKTILRQMDGTKTLSLTQVMGLNIYMFAPFNGQILWSTLFPDGFPEAFLKSDLDSYNIDPGWLIAATSIANFSGRSFCKTELEYHKVSCSQFLFTVARVQHSGNNGSVVAFLVSVVIIFLLLSLLSVLMYCLWRKKQVLHRLRLRLLLKQRRLRHPQGLLLKRKRMYEQTINRLQGELDIQPRSSKILTELKAALEGLHFVERYMASFPSDTLLGNSVHQEHLLVEDDATASADFTPACASQRGFWTVLLDRAFNTLLGAPEKEDFTEELRMLSLYDDCPPSTTPLTRPQPQLITTRFRENRLSLQQARPRTASLAKRSKGDLGATLHESETEEYSNPLYDKSSPPTLAVCSTKKTVSFSPIDEVFEGIYRQHSAANDSLRSFKEKPMEPSRGSGDAEANGG